MSLIKSKIKTTTIDKGFNNALEQINRVKGAPHARVGIQSGEESELLMIAAVNEFGSSVAGVPERSYIRSTIDENRIVLQELTNKLIGQVIGGKHTTLGALKIIGLKIESLIKKKITDLKTPPNAPSTIASKGSSNPLIDSGRLRSSIRSEVVE